MYLFFDTETTGLPDYNVALEDPAHPHIVQLGCILTDETGREMITWKAPIVPENYQIDEQGRAFEVNKITNAMANKYGVTLAQALRMFKSFEQRAELKVAFNYRFDGFLLKVAHHRAGMEPLTPAIDKYCCMKPMQDLKASLGLKSANLAACYEHITGQKLDNAHDALADVRAAKVVFFWLKEQGHFKGPDKRYVPKAAA